MPSTRSHQPASLLSSSAAASVLLFLLLLLLSSTALLAQTTTSTATPDSATTCAVGVPADGTIPSNWPVKNFTLVLTYTPATSNASTSSANSTSTSNSSFSSPSLWTINGQFPGPRVDVNEFDWVEVTVVTQLPAGDTSPTALHWHGLLQYSTPYSDGVSGISQCGLGNSNASITYRFCAYPSGSYWYHSLSGLQTMQGLYGPLVVLPAISLLNGTFPILANNTYDQDITFMIADTYATDISSPTTVLAGQPPQPSAIIVNGAFTGTSHLYLNGSNVLLRIYNAGSFRPYTFSIDGMAMTLLSLDGSAVRAVTLGSVRVGVGQRVTVSVNSSSISGYASVLYRVTAIPQQLPSSSPTASTNSASANQSTTWVGTIHLGSNLTDTSTPSYSATNSSVAGPVPASNGSFTDVNGLFAAPSSYEAIGVAYFAAAVSTAASATSSLNLDVFSSNSGLTVQSTINNGTFDTSTIESLGSSTNVLPLLYSQVYDIDAAIVPNVTQSEYPIIPPSNNSEYAVSEGAVLSVVLFNSDAVEHSFHLHGHHFWVVSASDNPLAEFLSYNQYIVRDTVVVPAAGWARIRFVANNPGAWLMSSSSDYYLAKGLALAILEETNALIPTYLNLPSDQLALCNGSLQTQLATALAAWHSANDPVTYANSALSQTSRIVIGSVVGGVTGGILLVVILCTIFGIKRDEPGKAGASANSPTRSGLVPQPTSITNTRRPSIELPDAPPTI